MRNLNKTFFAFSLLCSIAFVGCSKDDGNVKPDEDLTPETVTFIEMTTTKLPSKEWSIKVNASAADQANVWIDLNNNGTKDTGEAVTKFDENIKYTIDKQTIKVYGKITKFRCDYNEVTSLDVSKNSGLIFLALEGNQLTSLDVTNNTMLTDLYCSLNAITSLDVSKNTMLEKLLCMTNKLTSLDVSNNTMLTDLYCYKNKLTTLDVSKNILLTELSCGTNKLTSLDVSNLTKLQDLLCADSSTLTCVKVNQKQFDETSAKWNKDKSCSFSTTCP